MVIVMKLSAKRFFVRNKIFTGEMRAFNKNAQIKKESYKNFPFL
jgi:hypothetical protein